MSKVLDAPRVPTFERVTNKLAELQSALRLEFAANNRSALETVVAKIQAKTGEGLDVEEYRKKLTGGSAYVKQN